MNSLTLISYALGGMIGCGVAGTIQASSNKNLNPNIYFGVYTGLIVLMFSATLLLNRNLEPEIVLRARELGTNSNENVLKNLYDTCTTILKTISHPEVYFSLLYFII